MTRAAAPLVLATMAAVLTGQGGRVAELRNSKHDFSATSPAAIRSTAADNPCLFCHTPHRANPSVPLWNKSMQLGVHYQVYASETLQGSVVSPGAGDSSKLCLGCHDGTVALGDTVNNGQIPFQNVPSDQRLPAGSTSNLAGSSLSLASTHPITNVWPVASTQLRRPLEGDRVRLDASQKIQCSTCHDPHAERRDATSLRFLVKNNSGSAICITCHNPNGGSAGSQWSWDGSQGMRTSHATANNTFDSTTNGGIPSLGSHTGYTATSSNGCESCHRAHTGVQTILLLKEEQDLVCLQCHDGNPVTSLAPVAAALRKRYSHPSLGANPGHSVTEAPNSITDRHAVCTDCHNPHAARGASQPLAAPEFSPALLGVSGISADGLPRDPKRGTGEARYEFEICFKCHSSNPSQPQTLPYTAYGATAMRQVPSTNLQASLASAVSFHPVTKARGLDTGDVPSLLPAQVDAAGAPLPRKQLSATSLIYCSDCHNNDTGRNLAAGYTGAVGPHGSENEHLLERRYAMEPSIGAPAGDTPDLPYSSANYSLCYKCHSESNLMSPISSFPLHDEHVKITPCATCHDPHGVPNGSPLNHAKLINFDLRIVAPFSGIVTFQQLGLHKGTCTLRCHGVDHIPLSY